MSNTLAAFIREHFEVDGNDLDFVQGLFVRKEFRKDDFFLREGDVSREMGFVEQGFLRMYASNASGSKDITQWISYPGYFTADLGSFLFESPARFNIQAISSSIVYTITRQKFSEISKAVPTWPEIEKRFISKCFVSLENRIFQQLSMSAEERFDALFQSSPELFNQVPLHYIASMMGMTPETLSRIRKKQIS